MKEYSFLDFNKLGEKIKSAHTRQFGVFEIERRPREKDEDYLERCEVLEDLKFLLAAPDMKTVLAGRKKSNGRVRKMTIDRQIACLSLLPDFFDSIVEDPLMSTSRLPERCRATKTRGKKKKKLLF